MEDGRYVQGPGTLGEGRDTMAYLTTTNEATELYCNGFNG